MNAGRTARASIFRRPIPVVVNLLSIAGLSGCEEDPGHTCFGAGTPIATPDGPRPIEALRVGDQVLAYDLSTADVVVSEVTAVFVHGAGRTGTLRHRWGSVRVTPNHRVFVPSSNAPNQGEWIPAGHVQQGQPLVLLERRHISRSQALGFDERASQVETVYNITVARQHNYFAGGILVHNRKVGTYHPPAACSEQGYPRTTNDPLSVCSGMAAIQRREEEHVLVLSTASLLPVPSFGQGGSAGAGPEPNVGTAGAAQPGDVPRVAQVSIPTWSMRCDSGGAPGKGYLEYTPPPAPHRLEVFAAEAACGEGELLLQREEVVSTTVQVALSAPTSTGYLTFRLTSLAGESISTTLRITAAR